MYNVVKQELLSRKIMVAKELWGEILPEVPLTESETFRPDIIAFSTLNKNFATLTTQLIESCGNESFNEQATKKFGAINSQCLNPDSKHCIYHLMNEWITKSTGVSLEVMHEKSQQDNICDSLISTEKSNPASTFRASMTDLKPSAQEEENDSSPNANI